MMNLPTTHLVERGTKNNESLNNFTNQPMTAMEVIIVAIVCFAHFYKQKNIFRHEIDNEEQRMKSELFFR